MDKTRISEHVVNSKSGINSATRTFHSLRLPLELPPPHASLSVADYVFSRRRNSPWSDPVALIDAATRRRVSYSEFTHRTLTLAANLSSLIGLSKGDTAFILSSNLVKVPILYFALLSLGVIVSPANPISTDSEISRLVELSKPIIAFATSSTGDKLPKLCLGAILLDSPEFDSLMTTTNTHSNLPLPRAEVSQSDVAAILYSSGTTGKMKGVMLTHRNLTASVASYNSASPQRKSPALFLHTMAYFHVYGFAYCLRSVALSETVVLMERFSLRGMLSAVEKFRVTHLALVPPVVVAMIKIGITEGYDLSSLEGVRCGAAPLGKDIVAAFHRKFPTVVLAQGYGLTESTATVALTVGPVEARRAGTTGKLIAGIEAKIIDPNTGESMLPNEQGEIWLRGPSIMKGYVGDSEASSATLVDGWLKTGDLGYIDQEGFLYIVDRLKELIKYKAYQVAPAELEQLLQSHPDIKDAAVVPYPDEEGGQVPLACVVRQPQSSLGEAEIIDFIARQVAPYKKIRRVAFVDSIPKTASGKILRKDLTKIVLQKSFSKL
ncbi:hypothetical protein L6164_009020 [Bauhinia variegata]|uniref:Uncharacterized protein n=1 Tax=Bauhinia variegata TaxID=167791 RepID=A0ACB9PIA8_BAUVA|nr:hypothetical protein L6164_009020 [Bauhinia variegata]